MREGLRQVFFGRMKKYRMLTIAVPVAESIRISGNTQSTHGGSLRGTVRARNTVGRTH